MYGSSGCLGSVCNLAGGPFSAGTLHYDSSDCPSLLHNRAMISLQESCNGVLYTVATLLKCLYLGNRFALQPGTGIRNMTVAGSTRFALIQVMPCHLPPFNNNRGKV